MKSSQCILVFIYLVCTAGILAAQNNSVNHKLSVEIPEVALLGLVSENNSGVSFSSSSPAEAGNSIDFKNGNLNNDIWINYSSITKNSFHRRKIVAFVQGEMPEGIQLKVRASEAVGSGKGRLGHPTGEIVLTGKPADVISDIGSCFTGNGISSGHILTYELEYGVNYQDYTVLNAEKTIFHVVYTLTDHN